MSDSARHECPFISRCWLSGNYNYCKTATCTEPLVPKEEKREAVNAPVVRVAEAERDNPAPGELF